MNKVGYFSFLAALLLLITAGIIADPVIKAKIGSDQYQVGDVITVTIDIEKNQGFQGLFFDLGFNGSVLAFDGLEEGLLVHRTGIRHQLLYAASDPAASSQLGAHIVVAFGLEEKVLTRETGNLAALRFRVVDAGTVDMAYRFEFRDNGFKDEKGNRITSAVWENSASFRIAAAATAHAFIQIRAPYENQVFYTNEVRVNALFTAEATCSVLLENEDNGYSSGRINARTGSILNQAVPVVYGFNKIKATLFNAAGAVLAEDKVRVLRSQDDKFIKIIRPADHELLNTDMVEVRIVSSYSNVTVNGMNAEATGETDGANAVYRQRLWLKPGFNPIQAVCKSPEGAVYTDKIDVFYYKDNSVFRFVTPANNETFKTGGDALLSITGEIGSLYKEEGVPNTVTLKVVYYPLNPLLQSRVLVNNRQARIEETKIASGISQAAYMFLNDFPINLAGLESGEVEIIAYKNKTGLSWENEIHRIIRVDSNRLWIDLVQPHIYSQDVLNTLKKLEGFNSGKEPVLEGLKLTDDGTFSLKETRLLVKDADNAGKTVFGNNTVADIEETADGTLYALVNENYGMILFKKILGGSWERVLVREDIYGYDLCLTDTGILLGTSNLFSNANTGLYLFTEDQQLINIMIGEPLANVQFVLNHGGDIYLYGNDYSHLYTFNIYTLEEDNGRLKAGSVRKIPFANSAFLKQFALGADAQVAVLRDDKGRVTFYKNTDGTGFKSVAFDPNKFDPGQGFIQVIAGCYQDGAYNAYLLLRDTLDSALVVMDDKRTHRLLVNTLGFEQLSFRTGASLAGIGFKDNDFVFINRTNSNQYTLRTGQVLFDEIYPSTEPEIFTRNGAELLPGNFRVFATRYDTYYLGIGNDIPAARRSLYQFVREYEPYGQTAFQYINDDIEGLSGFSFEVDPLWLQTDRIEIGYVVTEQDAPVSGLEFAKDSIRKFLNSSNSAYAVYHEYDPVLRKDVVQVQFLQLQQGRYLRFDLGIRSLENTSPGLGNLTINKKIPVKLPKSSSELIYLPVHGFVYDSTVEEVHIKEAVVQLERNGAFTYNYPIHSSEKRVSMEIFCMNRAGETTRLVFQVEIFESLNGIWNITFQPLEPAPATAEGNEFHTVKEILGVSGNYYGLLGVTAGYEVYDYIVEAGKEQAILIRQGVFGNYRNNLEKHQQLPPGWSLPGNQEEPGPGYEYCAFSDQEIKLIPGRQELRLYVENPGGKRTEYKMAGAYPELIYDLPDNEQEIVITNLGLELLSGADIYSKSDFTINKKLSLDIFEAPDLRFTKRYTLYGEIKSLYRFQDLKIKSLGPEVTFDNGSTEIIVEVDWINRFQVVINIALPENCEKGKYELLFIPTKPVFNWMSTGLCLEATKSFVNTYLIPDFSPMDQWSETEKRTSRKLLQLKMKDNRYVPVNAQLRLLVNYTEMITGRLVETIPGGGIYKVKAQDNIADLYLTGAKAGRNRVQWWLSYDKGLIASSTSGKRGMYDYIFDLADNIPYAPTVVDFPVERQVYYDYPAQAANPLPAFTLKKDKATTAAVKLNQKLLWEDTGNAEVFAITDWKKVALREGQNYLEVVYKEGIKDAETVEYMFLLDSLVPEIVIDSYKYDADYKFLEQITALVKEANLDRVELHYRDDSTIQDSRLEAEVQVTYIGEDLYKVRWYDLTEQFEILPSPDYPVEVKARDHAGKYNSASAQTVLTGIAGLQRPDKPTKYIPDLPFRFQRDGNFPYYEHDDGSDPYNGHMKFYNSSIILENKQIAADEVFMHDREKHIVIGDNMTVREGGQLILQAGKRIVINRGFTMEQGAVLKGTIVQPEEAALFAPRICKLQHREQADAISILFQFRAEDEEYYQGDGEATVYRRVLTLYETTTASLYLAIRNKDNCLYLCREIREDEDVCTEEYLKAQKVPYVTDGQWNIINLGIQKLQNTIYLAVNDNMPVTLCFGNDDTAVFTDMLKQGAEYYFGAQNGDENSHYSIARVFYINEIVDTETALELVQYSGGTLIPGDEPHRVYNFLNSTDDVGTAYYQLRTEGGHFSPYENVDYSEEPGRGALKASTKHTNFLLRSTDGGVMFRDAANPVLINLDADYTIDQGRAMQLFPKSSLYPGKYFFGDLFGNHGIMSNRWYSVSGYIRAIEPDNHNQADVELVLRIDGNEQRMRLKEGEFHFVYEHKSGLPLNDVVLYLETKNTIIVDKTVMFNEGNYPLPPEGLDGLDKSRAMTTYIFAPKGTVEFWYKPFNVNNNGFVSYGALLFDSNFVQIGTRLKPGSKTGTQCAKFFARINGKGIKDSIELDTDVVVKEGWQHIQLSYSRDQNIAYFYIDGKMAARFENDEEYELPIPLGMADGNNVVLGSDRSGRFYAEGYLDEIKFSNLYHGSLYDHSGVFYNKYNPLSITYSDQPEPNLTISLNDPDRQVEDVFYCLDSRDGFFRQISRPGVVGAHGFDMKKLKSGAYLLSVRMRINGHRYRTTYTFVKNDRPCIIVNRVTPVIIRNVNSEIEFNLDYDGSYLLNSKEAVYAGMALRLKGTRWNARDNTEEEFTRACYVIQDYLHQDKTNRKWYTIDAADLEQGKPWQELPAIGKTLSVIFKDVSAVDDMEWELRSFYADEAFDPAVHSFERVEPEQKGIISNAYFNAELCKVRYTSEIKQGYLQTDENREYEYKIAVRIGSGSGSGGILNELGVQYRIKALDGSNESCQDIVALEGASYLDLYYDDILPRGKYGQYECLLALIYRGEAYGAQPAIRLNWEEVVDVITPEEEKYLAIGDFSLLYLDKVNDKAKLYLEYNQNALSDIYYELEVISTSTNTLYGEKLTEKLNPQKNFKIIPGIAVPEGASYIKISVSSPAEKLTVKTDLVLVNSATAPSVIMTNSVPSLIGYNNVMLSWRGYHEGAYKPDIAYSYNFDYAGWTAPNNDWRKLELYCLKEGSHNLRVKALYGGEESSEESVTFFVDISRPRFDPEKIRVEEIVDADGIPYAVNIIGEEGAVQDSSLSALQINGEPLKLLKNGQFVASRLNLEYDGVNEFVLTAFDRVGNFTDHKVSYNNAITAIVFPEKGKKIRYSPMTLVGKLNAGINVAAAIYVSDPDCAVQAAGDYTGWHRARINEDRYFFVDDLYINPGTAYREAHTPLEMIVQVRSGKTFKRRIDVYANTITMPVELKLSAHAVEGEVADTNVTIDCKANVPDISSWSIDFTGDDIYDLVDMVDNPALGSTHQWTHIYSSLGIVKPRVRIITNSGHYFSVTDQIIIHEKIKEASHVMVPDPVSMSGVMLPDNGQRLFVLAGKENNYRIDVYEVGRNETYISGLLFTVSLAGLGIENPVKIFAIDNEHLCLAANRAGRGILSVLKANQFGNYLPVKNIEVQFGDAVRDITGDSRCLYISFVNTSQVAVLALKDGLPDKASLRYAAVEIPNAEPLGSNLGLAKDDLGLLVTDYYHQRIVRLSDSLKVLEHTGSFGAGEGELIKPARVAAFANRLFLYDEGRADVQVFDPNFRIITGLTYHPEKGNDNYLEANFLTDVAGLSVLTREDRGRLYYYTLLLSRSTGKLAMLRLPQWEEMRARVRSNKIIFLKDKEVFTAKPTGSDLSRVLSSDSIPRIEGTLDYPALSPDGQKVVFTSRTPLYDRTADQSGNGGNLYAYDNLYMMDVTGANLQRIALGEINRYEIERPVFNSNGDRIIFSAKQTGKNWQLYVYDRGIGSVQRLFTSNENARFPYYSPDDRFIVFTTDNDGDEEIAIVDTENINVRVAVSNNNCRDSYPVWSPTYDFEIANKQLYIDSKIAFVSERNYHKGVYYLYIAHPTGSDVRVVTGAGGQTGGNPDPAAIEITTSTTEGDYPCFTGDAQSLVYEFSDGYTPGLKRYDRKNNRITVVNLPAGARRPAGMKNTITNFKVENINGNEVLLSWTPYVESEIFYTIEFKLNREGEVPVRKQIYTRSEARLMGLDMGVEYLFRVCIMENGIEEAVTQWKKVAIPEVAARPSYAIDETNPYLVKLHAWKPKPELEWKFTWIIDNVEITTAQTSQDLAYEFGTSGLKIVQLKTTNKANTTTAISDIPLFIDIKSNIKPVIEYTLYNNEITYIELSAEKSTGSKIDPASTVWTITGPGTDVIKKVDGSRVVIALDKYRHKININLKLRRRPVKDQQETDLIEKNLVVDLDLKEVKPVITYEADEANKQLFHFSGNNSFGNIDWYRAQWVIYADGQKLHEAMGVSTLSYEFPENSQDTVYSVALTIPRMSDGKTETCTVLVDVAPAPMQPVIDYEILELKEGMSVVGAKILFSCSGSRGHNIDFNSARWSVPLAGTYNEQPTQIGPTAVYNLFSGDNPVLVEVSLTLTRRGGADTVTATKLIYVKKSLVAKTEIIVNKKLEENDKGKVFFLDILSSTGPNIDWEKTEWLIDNQYSRKGAVVRYDLPASGEETIFPYTCLVYVHGSSTPLLKRDNVIIKAKKILPFITYSLLDAATGNVYELSVAETPGVNIDWERTVWYIYDGHENVVQKFGARISHAFALKSEALGYPVMVEMFFKGNTKPFVGYTTIDVAGDELLPVISWDQAAEGGDPQVMLFSAQNSLGSNIDWTQCKWTFGDSSEAQYGPTAVHKYNLDNIKREYKVSLTLFRKSNNGQMESKMVFKTVAIGADQVKPVIKAKLGGDGFLVLSAEESEGRGLFLDRSLWVFEGKGDSESVSVNQKMGKIMSGGFSNSQNYTFHMIPSISTSYSGYGVSTSFSTGGIGFTAGTVFTDNMNITEYEGFKDMTSSFSSSNTHNGAICRKYVKEYDMSKGKWDKDSRRSIMVTLFVYRASADGGLTGRSLTANIDLDAARQPGGVRYE